jgi:hypothetical protein
MFSFVLYFQRFAVIAFAVADITWHIHIRQEVHFDFDHAIALTGFAATAFHVKRETACAVTAFFGGWYFGK